jgi:outer membrane receptor protein involved in Fe transport
MNVSDRRVSLNPWRYVLMAGFAVFAANSALAQTSVGVPASPSGDSAPPLEEIVVTGSHVAKTALEQDVPIVSLSGLSIQKTGISNLADSLNQLPQFGSAGLSNTNTNFADDGAGVSTIELRNLGEPRTLVLIDGVRAVSGAPIGQGGPEYAVDVGTIPAFLIDHVDIVTGGGSASYGSEAVAGVVNIVLRDHYEGIMAQEQYGLTTEYGDSKTETFDLLAGTSFADEAGHVVFGLEYQDQGAVYSKDRPFAAKDTSVGGVYGPSSYNLGGNFGVGPGETGLVTDLGGNNIVPYNSQLYGVNREFYRTIQIPTDRLSLYEKASYDITPDITYFVNARFARTTATQQLEPIAIGPTTTIGYNGQTLVLPLNNAFVPPALAALGPTDDGNGNFADWRRRFVELGDRGADTTRTSYSVISGFKGDIDDRFKWETLFSYGETDSFQYQANSGNVIKLQEELNGCPSGGADGCVPINIFGPGSISQAAINYFKAPKFYDDQVTQTVVDADINGPIYTLPYGDIRLAVGFEYRREDGYNRPDALTAAGDGIDTQNPASGGEYDIREYYTELEVPVLKDIDYAKSLSIEGSWRYSDYSDVGGKQSYRYGITYAPVEDVLFRAVNSVAIRAPNLSELYQGRSQSAISVVDPCSNLGLATASNLAVRTANCRSFGVVPGFVENLNNQQSEISYTEGNTSLTNGRRCSPMA